MRLMARCRQLVAGRLIGRPDHWNEPDCNPTGYRRSDNGSAAALFLARRDSVRCGCEACVAPVWHDQLSAANASVIDQFVA